MSFSVRLAFLSLLLTIPAAVRAETPSAAPAPAAVEKEAISASAPASPEAGPATSTPQHSRILPVKIKPVQEGADGVSKAAPDIETQNEIDPDTLALYSTQTDGSLGPDLWKGFSRADVISGLNALPVPEYSSVQRDLTLRALLTQSAVAPATPDKDGKTNSDVFTARLSKLIQLGAYKEAMSLYEKLENPATSAESALAGMKAFVGNNQVAIACLEQRALDASLKSEDPFWSHLDKFCQKYIRSDDSGTDVSQSLMRASIAYAQDEKITVPGKFEDLNEKSLIELLVMSKAGTLDRGKWSVGTAAKLHPHVIGFLLALDPPSVDQKLALMTVAVRQGLRTPLDLDAAYEQATTAREWSPFLTLRKNLKAAQTSAAKSTAVRAMLAKMEQVSPAALTPFIDVISALEPAAPFTASEARQILDVLIAGEASIPTGWVKLAYEQEEAEITHESGESALISVWLPAPGDTKKAADKSKDTPAALPVPKTQNDAYLIVLASFLEDKAAKSAVQKNSYEKLLSLTGGSNYVMPSDVLMVNLKKAAQTGNLGRVVLSGLQALDGQKPEQIHPSVMVQVLKAFDSVGLSEETASLAHEVLAGLTKEKKEN